MKHEDALETLSSATDIANSWARELGVLEGTLETLPKLIDRLWAITSSRHNMAFTIGAEGERAAIRAALLEQLSVLKDPGFEV